MIVWFLLVLAMAALVLGKRLDDRRAHVRADSDDDRGRQVG
jgi:hypothetical protein